MTRMPVAGLLAWLVPGLGHIYLGHRVRGLVCLVTITATFWTGVAIGSVRGTVDPHKRKLWFVAQLGTAGNALAGYALHRWTVSAASDAGARLESRTSRSRTSGTEKSTAHWASAEVGVHYAGVAGLLNLLVILDAIARAEPSLATRRGKRRPVGGVP